MTSAQRQKAFRERMLADGFKPVTVWVPAMHAADFMNLARAMCEDTRLELVAAPVRNSEDGKLVKVL